MPENYEVMYTHPGGAIATFVRQGGELDALAKGLDAEQFWVFKQVKALLVRNDPGDLEDANRMMATVGFAAAVRVIAVPQPVPAAAMRAAIAPMPVVVEQHVGPHLPSPSYWPLITAISATIAFSGLLFLNTTLLVCAVGLCLVFISLVGWGLEPA